MGDGMTIGEVAERAGINASAIRYYERAGLLPEPGRVGGRRRYGPEVLGTLALVGAAKRAGLTIAEIRSLFHGFAEGVGASERWRSLAARKIEEVDGQMARLRRMRVLLAEALRCDCASLDECAGLLDLLPENWLSRNAGDRGPSSPALPWP